MKWCSLAFAVLVVVVLAAALLLRRAPQREAAPAARHAAGRSPETHGTRDTLALEIGADGAYATSSACRECHAEQFDSWHGSFHRTMTQRATSESIAVPPGEYRLRSRGRSYVLHRTDEALWVDMPDPEWEHQQQMRGVDLETLEQIPRVRRRVVMTTGSHHYQAYWIHGDAGADLRQVPWVYHLEETRWIPREDAFLHDPHDDRDFAVWNAVCIQCHSVAGRPKVNATTNRFESHVVELGIACEACHGPAAEHVRQARRPARGETTEATPPIHSIVNPARLTARRSSEVCGQCHAFFFPKDRRGWWDRGYRGVYVPGGDLEAGRTLVRYDTRSPDPHVQEQLDLVRDGGLYWRDGTVRVGGREYLGLIASPCHQRGPLSCLSCHSMHQYTAPSDQLGTGMDGNQACLQCHESFATRLEAHTHHPPGSSGSLCYNCHMPHTSYALFKAIRSHRIDSPRAATTRDRGKPNACNLCHLDQSLDWTSRHLTQWYGQPPVELDEERRNVADTAYWLLRGDAGQRAVNVWATGWEPARRAAGTDWLPPYLAQLLQDPYPVVRLMAHRSLRTFPEYAEVPYDFLDPADERAAAGRQVLKIWQQRPQRTDTYRPATLIHEDGSLDTSRFDRLLLQRDDRPVFISE